MLLLQYCKLKRKSHELFLEWMGRLQTREVEYTCNEYDRRLIKQFIYGLNNEVMIHKILLEILTLENINDASSE